MVWPDDSKPPIELKNRDGEQNASKSPRRSIFKAYPLMREFVLALASKKFLTELQADRLLDVAEGRLFSLRIELRAMISAGCALIVFGAGLLIKRADMDWRSIGTSVLALVGFGCVTWASSRIGRFTRTQLKEKAIVGHTVLNLGVLFLGAAAGILRFHYEWPKVVFLVAGILFAVLSIYCDSKIVLAHAALTLGTFLGIEALSHNWTLFSGTILRPVGAGYALFLVLTALGLKKWRLKEHFSNVLIDIAVPLALVAGITGLSEDFEANNAGPLWGGLGYSGIVAAGAYWVGFRLKSLRFKFYALVSFEVATVIVMGWVADKSTVISETGVMFYVFASCSAMMWLAVQITRRSRQDKARPKTEGTEPNTAAARIPNIREHDDILFRHDAAQMWKKAGLISAEQRDFLIQRAGPRPAQMNPALRALLQFGGLVAAAALFYVLAKVIAGEGSVGDVAKPLSVVWSAAGLIAGIKLARAGRFRHGIDDAAWLVFISAAVGAAGWFTEDSKTFDATDVAIWTGVLAASVPAIIYADFYGSTVMWCLLTLQCIRKIDHAYPIAVVFLVITVLTGFLRRETKWRQRSRQLVLLQGYSLLAIYLILSPDLHRIFGSERPEWLQRIQVSGLFASSVLAVIVPMAYLWIGVKHRARLPLDLGIVTFAVTVMILPLSHGLCSDAQSFILGGTVLVGAGFFVRNFLVKGEKGVRFGLTDNAALTSVDDAWTSEDLDVAADELSDWVTGLRESSANQKERDSPSGPSSE